jgi:hypothetical protein
LYSSSQSRDAAVSSYAGAIAWEYPDTAARWASTLPEECKKMLLDTVR